MLQSFLTVGQQILTLYLLLVVGFVLGKVKLLDDRASVALSSLVMYVVSPCMMVVAFQRPLEHTALHNFGVVTGVSAVLHVVFIAAAMLLIRDRDRERQNCLRFAAVFSNCGFMGYPLMAALLGSIGGAFVTYKTTATVAAGAQAALNAVMNANPIGIVVTTDGTVSDIPRAGYAATEKRIIEELDALGKPYIILLNSTHPDAPETRQLAEGMARDYDHTVLPVSCVDLDAAALGNILRQVLYEFPVQELDFALPRWVTMLENGHWLQTQVYDAAMQLAGKVARMKDVPAGNDAPALECDAVQRSAISGIDLANGIVRITVELKPEIFYQVLSEQTGLAIGDEAGLMPCIMELAKAKREYEKVRSALEQVEATGYGIVMPSVSELRLEQPEIVKQGSSYGVRLEASAPSIQMMKATIHTELSPIVGTEKQSEDLAHSLLQGFADDPEKLWESNIFGKSLHELVNEGLQNKLLHMPQEARTRLQETLERVINEGCTGLICILI